MRSVIAVLCPLVLAACTGPHARHEAASIHEPVVYTCEDGLNLRVRFARDGAHVTLPSGEAVFLPQQSGGRYAGAQHEIAGNGERMTWKGPQRVPIGCRVVP